MEAGRSEEIFPFGDGSCRVSHDDAASEVYLCVNAEVDELTFACFFVMHERTLVLAGGCVGFVELPVQRVDAHSTRQHHDVPGVLLYVLGALGVIADDDTRVALACRELQVWILLEIVFRDGEANGIGGYHALIIVLMFLEIVFQYILDHGRTLTMTRNDERTAIVAILKVVVERCFDVGIG